MSEVTKQVLGVMLAAAAMVGCSPSGDTVCFSQPCEDSPPYTPDPVTSLQARWNERLLGAGLALDGVATSTATFSFGVGAPSVTTNQVLEVEDANVGQTTASYRVRGAQVGTGVLSVRLDDQVHELELEVMNVSEVTLGIDGVFVPADAPLAFMSTMSAADVILRGVDTAGDPRRLLDASLTDGEGAPIANHRVTLPPVEGAAESTLVADSFGERTIAFTMIAAADRVIAEPLLRDDATDTLRQCFSLRAGDLTVVETDWRVEARDESGAIAGTASQYANCAELEGSGDITVTAQAAGNPALSVAVTIPL